VVVEIHINPVLLTKNLHTSIAPGNFKIPYFHDTYIILHSMDPKSVKKIVGCGISHTISGTYIHYN
jgi:hypothetical protein